MSSIRDRYLHLRALAADQAGTPEDATAARLADDLETRFPDLSVPDEPATIKLAWRDQHERDLLDTICTFLDIEAFNHRGSLSGRWRKSYLLRGDRQLLEYADELYRYHRKSMRQVLRITAIGYIQGALPLPSSKYSGKAKLDEDQLAVAMAGMAAGKKNRRDVLRALPEGEVNSC